MNTKYYVQNLIPNQSLILMWYTNNKTAKIKYKTNICNLGIGNYFWDTKPKVSSIKE